VGKQFQDKYGEATYKTLAINTGTWTEEGWVDVQVTIPGTTVGLIARDNGIRIFRAADAPSFNIMGRAISGLSSMQTLAVKSENGATRLVLNAR
jgi:hypothetical protein